MKNYLSYTGLVMIAGAFLFLLSNCTVVRQGEFGVKRTLGKYSDGVYTSGLKMFNPFTSKIVKLSAQTENMEVDVIIPSREGLSIQSEVSILYQVQEKDAPNLLRSVGRDYERTVIMPVFRSAVADVTSKYYAKDMHSGNRAEIEVAIRDMMGKTLINKGIIVESVLLKSIALPRSLAKAIEDKLEAEQQAQRMQFVLQREQQEADRMRIKAKGERDANQIISEGLTPEVLQYKAIEAWLQLSLSPNAKIVMSNGTMPLVMDPEAMQKDQKKSNAGTGLGLNLPLEK